MQSGDPCVIREFQTETINGIEGTYVPSRHDDEIAYIVITNPCNSNYNVGTEIAMWDRCLFPLSRPEEFINEEW